MRLLFVSHYALPHLGGIEVAIDALARELTRRGHQVTHIASDARRGHEAAPSPAPYTVERVRALNVLEERTGAPWPLFGPGLLSALRREVPRADVVHAHGFLYASSIAALLLARRNGNPRRVLTEHVGHVDYESRGLDALESAAIASIGRLAARSAQALVHLNDKVAAELARLAPGARIVRIGNGVDTDSFRPASTEERRRLRAELGWDEGPRVLFAGRLVAKKGVELALAVADAADGDFEFAVAGPGRLRVPTSDNVELLGPLPRERMSELYRAADLLLLPSRGEGFPLTVQEAMASGLPVVLADDPAYRPHLDGAGDGARLVAPDGAALVQAIRALLADREALARAGSQAADHARRSFSWVAAADAHERLYGELAEGAAAR